MAEETQINPNQPKNNELLKVGLGVVVIIAVLGLLIFAQKAFQKKNNASLQKAAGGKQQPSNIVPGKSPPSLPQVKDTKDASALEEYFMKASPVNFKKDFMTQVPQIASTMYQNYTQATDAQKKLEAARAFYIYLNNPGVNRSDPKFDLFIADVKADLEKTLGRPLY